MKCSIRKPPLAKELTDEDQGALCGDRHAALGLYGPVKDEQRQTSDTTNDKQQSGLPRTPV